MEQRNLPNGALIIVLGIFGYLCCCLAGLGLIPSGIAFFLATKSEKIYNEDPEQYDNYSQIKTGKIVALIALIINILLIVRIIYVIYTVGWDTIQEEFMIAWQEALEAQGE